MQTYLFGLQSPVFVSLPLSPLILIITYAHCKSFVKNVYMQKHLYCY